MKVLLQKEKWLLFTQVWRHNNKRLASTCTTNIQKCQAHNGKKTWSIFHAQVDIFTKKLNKTFVNVCLFIIQKPRKHDGLSTFTKDKLDYWVQHSDGLREGQVWQCGWSIFGTVNSAEHYLIISRASHIRYITTAMKTTNGSFPMSKYSPYSID